MYDEHKGESTGIFGPGSDDEMCVDYVWYYPKLVDEFVCNPIVGCAEYCGRVEVGDDDTAQAEILEHDFGTPCGERPLLQNHSNFTGCADGSDYIFGYADDDDFVCRDKNEHFLRIFAGSSGCATLAGPATCDWLSSVDSLGCGTIADAGFCDALHSALGTAGLPPEVRCVHSNQR